MVLHEGRPYAAAVGARGRSAGARGYHSRWQLIGVCAMLLGALFPQESAAQAAPPAASTSTDRDAGVVDEVDGDFNATGAPDVGQPPLPTAATDGGLEDTPAGSDNNADPSAVAAPRLLPPQVIHAVPVALPAGTRLAGDGLLVELQLDAEGKLTAVEFVQAQSAEVQALVAAALADYRFAPAYRDGAPIAAKVQLQMAAEQDVPTTTEPSTVPVSTAASQRQATPPAAPAPLPAVQDAPSYGARAQVDKPQPGAASQVKLRGVELTHVPGTFGEPLRVVGSLPGVARSPLGLGFYVVRGASFQNSGFFVDGFAVPLLYHLGAGPAIIPSRLVDRLDFYAGGYPLEFGRYTAGVIALGTRVPQVDSWQLEFEVDLLRASALLVVPLPEQRGSIALGYRRSYYELILPLITDDVVLSYADYQLHADYRLAPNLRASLFLFGSRDFLDFELGTGSGSTTGSSASGLRYEFDQVRLGIDWSVSDRLAVRWSAIAGPTLLEAGSNSTGSAGLAANTRGMRIGQRLALRFSPEPLVVTTLGIDQNTFRYTIDGEAPSVREFPGIPEPAPPSRAVSIRDTLWELGLAPYFEQTLRPGPVTFTWGIRAEYLRYGAVTSWTFDPRAVLRLRLSPAFTVKGASGLFTQPPLPFQISADAANPDLRPNRALQNSVGVEWKLPLDIEFDSSLFYNYMWNLTRGSLRATVGENGTIEQRFFADDGLGRAYGLEVLLRRKLQRDLFGWLSYTLSRSERYLDGGAKTLFFYDQTHVLNFALSYAFAGFRVGLKLTMASGRPTTNRLDPEGERTLYDVDAHNFDTDFGRERVRLPLFHQLDVRIDRDFALGPVSGSVYLDILNVYNAANSEGYQYSFDNRLRGRVPGMPFLPTIGVRGVLR